MYKFNEESLRKGIQFGLGSQGIWTPELEDIMFNKITNEALRIYDVCELCNGTEIFNPFDGMELPCACTTKIVVQTDR